MTLDWQCWPAPAKLNLMLRITGRRDDGYHELQTVFQLLGWGDEIELAVTTDGRVIRESGPQGVAEQEDLCVRAARLLQPYAGSDAGVRLKVNKRIPIGAGLGGGSSDAATVLKALNRLWRCGLSDERLSDLGLSLGADVPVFVHGRSAFAEGVGERLQPLDLGERDYVLVFPNIQISTAELFAAPELPRAAKPLAMQEWAEHQENVFQELVIRRYPELKAMFENLAIEGRPRLTGTGSCIFMAMEDTVCAQAAAGRLNYRYNAVAVQGVNSSPVASMGAGER